MKRNNTEQVGEVIRRLLRQEGLETPLNEYRLVDAWKDVVGETIARYTTNIYIKNQVLYCAFVLISTSSGTDDESAITGSQFKCAGWVASDRQYHLSLIGQNWRLSMVMDCGK